MKVCIISSRFYPQLVGSGTSAYVIASELAQRGHSVTVLVDSGLKGERAHESLPFRIEYISDLEHFAVGKAGFKHAAEEIYHHVSSVQPDVLHVCNFMSMLLISTFRGLIRCPVVFTFFNTPVISKRSIGYYENGNLDTGLASYIIKSDLYDRLLVGSRHYADSALSLGADRNKMVVSYLAPEIRSFEHENAGRQRMPDVFRDYFSTDDEKKPYILLPSRITEQKGVVEAIKALSIVNQNSRTRYSLMLTGMADPFDPQYAKKVEMVAKKEGVEDCILVPRRVIDRTNLSVFFKEASLALVPSWYEGLGLAAIEAQYLEVPLVASDTTGLNEVVQSGVSGLLFPPGDSELMAEAMLKILREEVDVSLMTKNAKQTVKRFSLDNHINDIERCYEDAIRQKEYFV